MSRVKLVNLFNLFKLSLTSWINLFDIKLYLKSNEICLQQTNIGNLSEKYYAVSSVI